MFTLWGCKNEEFWYLGHCIFCPSLKADILCYSSKFWLSFLCFSWSESSIRNFCRLVIWDIKRRVLKSSICIIFVLWCKYPFSYILYTFILSNFSLETRKSPCPCLVVLRLPTQIFLHPMQNALLIKTMLSFTIEFWVLFFLSMELILWGLNYFSLHFTDIH